MKRIIAIVVLFITTLALEKRLMARLTTLNNGCEHRTATHEITKS